MANKEFLVAEKLLMGERDDGFETRVVGCKLQDENHFHILARTIIRCLLYTDSFAQSPIHSSPKLKPQPTGSD